MNLFATDECPRRSAEALDDARVVSQCLETAQLLSTATSILLPGTEGLYRPSHEAHPVARWVRSSWEAFSWTLQHGLALLGEYAVRYPKGGVHRSSEPVHRILGMSSSLVQPRMFRPLTQPPTGLCNHAANLGLGIDFRHVGDVPSAYRMYLCQRWLLAPPTRRPRWTNRPPPDWARETCLELL